MIGYFGVLAAVALDLFSPVTVAHNLDSNRPQHRVGDESENIRISIDRYSDLKNLTSITSSGSLTFATQKEGKLYYLPISGSPRVLKDYAQFLGDSFVSEVECGLLSVAYDASHHPKEIFVTYTTRSQSEPTKGKNNDMLVVRQPFTIKNKEIVLSSTWRVIFRQSFESYIHHAGTLVFDGRGRLYLSVGDGGPQGDPEGHGQRLDSYRGKLLRIYPVPSPEIVVYGLRNPWKYSIVKNTAYIGNVGHNTTESIVYIPSLDAPAPYNGGWNLYEGSQLYSGAPRKPTRKEEAAILTPIFEYPTDDKSETTPGRAVIGGYLVPGRSDLYVFSDNVSSYIYVLQLGKDGEWWQISKKKLPDGANPYSLGLVHGVLFALTTKGMYTITLG